MSWICKIQNDRPENKKWFFDIFSGYAQALAIPGSAVVATAVIGVPPITSHLQRFFNATARNATHPMKIA